MYEIDFDFRGDPLGGQISDCKSILNSNYNKLLIFYYILDFLEKVNHKFYLI